MLTQAHPHRVRPLNPIGEQDEGMNGGGADDAEEEEEQEEITCGACRKPPIRVAKDPRMPTEAEVEEHNATHLPHRSWCPVCIKARGKEDPHKPGSNKGSIPIASMDYKEFGEEEDEDDKIKTIVTKDEDTGNLSAHVCEHKGASDSWIVDRLCDDIKIAGEAT